MKIIDKLHDYFPDGSFSGYPSAALSFPDKCYTMKIHGDTELTEDDLDAMNLAFQDPDILVDLETGEKIKYIFSIHKYTFMDEIKRIYFNIKARRFIAELDKEMHQ